MWLITSILAAVIATVLWKLLEGKYNLGLLGIMLWGLSAMIFVDHILGWEGGPFLEMTTDGLVPNGIVLGLLMLIPILAVWGASLIISRYRDNGRKRSITPGGD